MTPTQKRKSPCRSSCTISSNLSRALRTGDDDVQRATRSFLATLAYRHFFAGLLPSARTGRRTEGKGLVAALQQDGGNDHRSRRRQAAHRNLRAEKCQRAAAHCPGAHTIWLG